MKILLSLLSLVSLSAFAMPTIGDYVKLVGFADNNNISIEYEITNYDSTKDLFEVTQSTTYGNQTSQIDQSWMGRDDLINDQQVQDTLANCASLGGTSETISTKVGEFETCNILDQSSQTMINVGKVPFGTVKIIYGGLELLVDSFKFGN